MIGAYRIRRYAFFDAAQKAVKKIFKKVLARISISCILAFAAEARGVSSVG